MIGDIHDSNRGIDYPMTKVNDNTWESAPLELRADTNFKVRQGATRELEFGTECYGPNIVAESDGVCIVPLVWYGSQNGTVTLVPGN